MIRNYRSREEQNYVFLSKDRSFATKVIARTIETHPKVAKATVTLDDSAGKVKVSIRKKGVIELWPSVAEFYVYDSMLYRTMASHQSRNERYFKTFKELLPNKIALEIGPGPEVILSRLAIEAGAKKVYAVELLKDSYIKAKEAVLRYGLEDKIVVINEDVTFVELPERVDYCFSEIVGSIGGAEGAAVIINKVKRLMKDSRCMIPQRSVTKIAAVSLPAAEFFFEMKRIAAHYTKKIFEQTGYPFDLRVCVKHFPNERVVTNSDIFEELNFRYVVDTDTKHDICLTFNQECLFTGFLIWLNLEVSQTHILDTLEDQRSWLPIYFPLFHEGIRAKAKDRLELSIKRRLSKNGLNPDFVIEGELHRQGLPIMAIYYESRHEHKLYCSNQFYGCFFNNWLRENDDEHPETNEPEANVLHAFLTEKLPGLQVPVEIEL
ncbi:MAG: hypothetical protein HY273_16605 [Gammaproteobacteria bacterium]|nr:hypothetical protein [Gammaproteobacteria bacterium]